MKNNKKPQLIGMIPNGMKNSGKVCSIWSDSFLPVFQNGVNQFGTPYSTEGKTKALENIKKCRNYIREWQIELNACEQVLK